MSWMDSWSRPKKNAATPPPLYLTAGGDQVRYCHTCGRVIGSRKSQSAKTASTEVKFCSDRCKRHKLRPADRRIEAAFAALLDGQDASHLAHVQGEPGTATADNTEPQTPNLFNDKSKHDNSGKRGKQQQQQKTKGDPRIIVLCSQVETLVYGPRGDPEKVFGRKKNRARRGVADDAVWKSVDMEDGQNTASDSDTDTGTASAEEGSVELGNPPTAEEGGVPVAADEPKLKGRVRPPQSESDVNGSVGGEKGWSERVHETPEMLQKRREGQRKAEEKEMVKSAARRAVVFGLESGGGGGNEKPSGESKKGKKKGEEEEEKGDGKRRLCEAVMNGAVVEPSYAKGDWGIRWREI